MKIIGVTGGIGCGKSKVSAILASMPKTVKVDADELSRSASRSVSVLEKIKATFGDEYVNENGLDRKKMAALVFSNEEKREELNSIIHPEVRKGFLEVVETAKKDGLDYVIYDCPLLFEEGLDKDCDMSVMVYASKEIRIKRVMERDSLTYEQVLSRVNAQMDDDEKSKLADVVIVNEGTIEELESSCYELYRRLQNES